MARTFLDYYKLVGYISAVPSSSLNPKPGRQSARERDKTANDIEFHAEDGRLLIWGYPLFYYFSEYAIALIT